MNVSNYQEFMKALSGDFKKIILVRTMMIDHPIFLPEGVTLKSQKQEDGELPVLIFQMSDGIAVTKNNQLIDLNIIVPSNKRAVFLQSQHSDLGKFLFQNLNIVGQISFIMRNNNINASLLINDITIESANTKNYFEQPQKYGVNVLQGALTIYNFNSNNDSQLDVEITDISIGRKNNPVIGSGVFIGGYGDVGGETKVSRLTTNAIYSTGNIPFGVSDYITAGIFISTGCLVESIISNGEITTYGVNDMVLDVWGEVTNWQVNNILKSYGPSGVGLVNFGIIENFITNFPIETFGTGARGYNQYDGTINYAEFDSIRTYNDGSVGVQISKKIGTLLINGNIETFGGIGNSLVKGQNVQLPAYGLSIKDGGVIEKLKIKGNIITHGDNVVSYITEGNGTVKHSDILGKIEATGNNSKKEQ